MIARTLLHLLSMNRNLKTDSSCIRKLQNRKLRRILKYAYNSVPFYQEKLRSVGIYPEDIRTVDDLHRLPIITKSEIQTTRFEDRLARSPEGRKFVERETSGSTGIPLRVAIDPDAIDVENALWMRAYFENGMMPWDRMARITDPRNFPLSSGIHEKFGLMRSKFISVFDDVQKQSAIINEYKPDVIRGYTTCVENLAGFFVENGVRVKPCLVFTSAELLDRKARALINMAFNTDLFDLYVSVELGLIAWECNEHLGYHINADNLIVEFVNDGESADRGEKGELVCTSLTNKAMPLIRYRIGDVGVASNELCKCGIGLPLMKIVEGRRGDYLRTIDGRRIPPIIFFPFPFEDVSYIKQFRIIQERKDRIVIEMVITESDDGGLHEALGKARKNVKNLFGDNMEVEFSFVERIDRDETGKLKKIISRLPNEEA